MARVKELALSMRGGECWSFIENNHFIPLWQYQTAFSRAMRDNRCRTWESVTPRCRETEDSMYRVTSPNTFFYINYTITQTQERIDAGGEDAGAFRAYYHWLGTVICLAFQSCHWTDEHEAMLTRLKEIRAAEPEPPVKTPDEFIPLVRYNLTRIPCETPLVNDCESEEETTDRDSPTQEPSDNENDVVDSRILKERLDHTGAQKSKSHHYT